MLSAARQALVAQGTSSHVPLVFQPVVPELILAGAAIAILLWDAIRQEEDQVPLALGALAGIAAAAAYTVWLWSWVGKPGHPASVVGGMVAADRGAVLIRPVLLHVASLHVILSFDYLDRAHPARDT